MTFHPIDLNHWSRTPYYHHYLHEAACSYNITVNLDITDLLEVCREKQLKFYPVSIYLTACAVNNHIEFRTCLDETGVLGYWDLLHPSYTWFQPESETFTSICTPFQRDFGRFYQSYLEDTVKFGSVHKLNAQEDIPANIFPFSALPWISFNEFNLHLTQSTDYLLPIFTTGKYFLQNERILLPFSMRVHHAVCDGFHTARLIQEIQEMADRSAAWLNL